MGSTINSFVRISLLAILAIGGQASVCSVASLIGIDAHHHDHPAESSRVCVAASDCHDEDRVPCPEECDIELAEVLQPDLLETPSCPMSDRAPKWITGGFVFLPQVSSTKLISTGDPPEASVSTGRAFTGRFLV